MPNVEIERSLWPKSLRAEVRTPTAIIRAQADLLSRLTGDKLRGELTRPLSKIKSG